MGLKNRNQSRFLKYINTKRAMTIGFMTTSTIYYVRIVTFYKTNARQFCRPLHLWMYSCSYVMIMTKEAFVSILYFKLTKYVVF